MQARQSRTKPTRTDSVWETNLLFEMEAFTLLAEPVQSLLDPITQTTVLPLWTQTALLTFYPASAFFFPFFLHFTSIPTFGLFLPFFPTFPLIILTIFSIRSSFS